MLRTLAGFTLAPLIGVTIGALITTLLFAFTSAGAGLGGFAWTVLLIFGGLFYTYPFLIVFGVTLYLVMRRFGILSHITILVVGTLFGCAGWIIASSPMPNADFYYRAVAEGAFALISGLASAETFWKIAVCNNSTNQSSLPVSHQ